VSHEPLDVAIVGAGPIGISLAVACKRHGLVARVLEAGQVGNTIAWWAPATRWFSSNDRIAIAGTPLQTVDQTKATREQYLAYLREVVLQHKIDVATNSPVRSAVKSNSDFIISFADNLKPSVRAKHVVLAVGGTDHPNRLNIPGEELPHVDGYFREPHRYFGRRVLIVGGRNSAVEAAIRAHHCGASVTISYRQEAFPAGKIKYWLMPEIEGLIRSQQIRAYFNSIPIEITSSHVRLQSEAGNINVDADDVLTMIGYHQDKQLFRSSGVELIGESQRPVYEDSTMMTNVTGVYVAGTAIAGTQSSRYKVFLENCHEHIGKIITSITGKIIDVQSTASESLQFRANIEAMPET
jgi:thioredoxin reductase (NADPH)